MRISDWSSDVCSSDLEGSIPQERSRHDVALNFIGAAKNRPAPAIEVVVTHEARALRRAENVRSRPMQVRRIVRRAHRPLDLKRNFREILQYLGAPELEDRIVRAVLRDRTSVVWGQGV